MCSKLSPEIIRRFSKGQLASPLTCGLQFAVLDTTNPVQIPLLCTICMLKSRKPLRLHKYVYSSMFLLRASDKTDKYLRAICTNNVFVCTHVLAGASLAPPLARNNNTFTLC